MSIILCFSYIPFFITQEQVRSEQADVTQQREQLYRKLETLQSQGILIGHNLPTAAAPSPVSTSSGDTGDNGESPETSPSPTTEHPKRKTDTAKWKPHLPTSKASTLPLNLISTTNQQKVFLEHLKSA